MPSRRDAVERLMETDVVRRLAEGDEDGARELARRGARHRGARVTLLVLGLSHKTAPVEQREKAALTEEGMRALLRELRDGRRP